MLLTLEGRVTFQLKLGIHSTLCRGGVLLTPDAGVVFIGFTIVKKIFFSTMHRNRIKTQIIDTKLVYCANLNLISKLNQS